MSWIRVRRSWNSTCYLLLVSLYTIADETRISPTFEFPSHPAFRETFAINHWFTAFSFPIAESKTFIHQSLGDSSRILVRSYLISTRSFILSLIAHTSDFFVLKREAESKLSDTDESQERPRQSSKTSVLPEEHWGEQIQFLEQQLEIDTHFFWTAGLFELRSSFFWPNF